MDDAKGSKKKYPAYIIYGILLTMALLYLRFPAESIKNYLQITAGGFGPELQLSIKKVSPALPLGLTLEKTEFMAQGVRDRPFVRTDRLTIKPRILSLFRDIPPFSIKGWAYEGVLAGYVRPAEKDKGTPLTGSLELHDIHIEENSSLYRLVNQSLVGNLSGNITFQGDKEAFLNGEGEADLILTKGWVKLFQPILSLNVLDFDELLIELTLKDKRLNLSRLELKGKSIDGTASGDIYFKDDLGRSILNLTGSLEPKAELAKDLTMSGTSVRDVRQRLKGGKIPFQIKGTMEDPKMILM